MEQKKLPCLAAKKGDIHERVITCGDPDRAKKIADLLDDVKVVAKNREFSTYNGTYKGTEITVSSHGVGAGGAAILFESLLRAGAKVIIRVGTCGGMQEDIDAGSIVIATGACREEGVTDKMLPLSYPAIASSDVVKALEMAAKKRNVKTHTGIILTQALFYPGLIESTVKTYMKAGVLAMENEAAALLVTASLKGAKAGVILAADAKAFELVGVEGYEPDKEAVHKAVEDEIKIALDAMTLIEI